MTRALLPHLLPMLLMLFIGAHAAADSPSASIYQLSAQLTNQSGQTHGLDVYRGHPVLITMFYGSCPMACPLLIETVRATERTLPAADRSRLRVLMISIDPERDTVASLQALTLTRRIDTSRWTVANTDAATVRKIAAVLNVQYRRLPDGEFNHSSIVTLLTPSGEIAAQTSMLGKADPALLAAMQDIP